MSCCDYGLAKLSFSPPKVSEMAVPCSWGVLSVPFDILALSLITSLVGPWSSFVLCSSFWQLLLKQRFQTQSSGILVVTQHGLKEGSRAQEVIASFCVKWLCLELGRMNGRL